MRRRTLNLECYNEFEILTSETQRTIKGGTDDSTSWYSIFEFGNNTNLTESQIDFIKGQIDIIGSTDLGKDFLDTLYKDFSESGESIVVSSAFPEGSNIAAQYNIDTNTLNFGKYLDYTDADGVSSAYIILAHELYHAYEDIKGESNTGIRAEVDAYLFSALAAKEYDEKNGANYYDLQIDTQLRAPTGNEAAHDAFVKAFKDIVENGNFTLENYNALINNMKEGFAPAVSSQNTQKLEVNPVNDLNTTSIDEMFERFNESSPGLPSDDGSSGGGDSIGFVDPNEDYDEPNDDDPWDDYNPWDDGDSGDDQSGWASIDDDYEDDDPWDYSQYC